MIDIFELLKMENKAGIISYFLHYNAKGQSPFMVSEIKINLNGKGDRILVNNGNLLLSIPSACPQEPMIC